MFWTTTPRARRRKALALAGGTGIGMGPVRRPRPVPAWLVKDRTVADPGEAIILLAHAPDSEDWHVLTVAGMVTVKTRQLTSFGRFSRICADRIALLFTRTPPANEWLKLLDDLAAPIRESIAQDRAAQR
jgi:hypothetical protein